MTDRDDVEDDARLRSIALTGLSNAPDSTMDRLASLAARLLGADVGLVSLVDDHRQFFPGQQGLPAPIDQERQTPLPLSICRSVVRSREVLQIDDLAADGEWAGHEAFTVLGVGSYLGAPLVDAADRVLGTLCALGPAPRVWTIEERQLLTDLALATSSELQARIAVAEANAARDRSEESLGRIETMADVSSALISTMDPAASIERMLEVIVERFAEWSFVFIAATDDDPAQAFVRHRQPDVAAAIAAVTSDPELRLRDMAMTQAVLDGTRPFVMLDNEAAQEAASHTGTSIPVFDELGIGPLMLVPMSIGRRVVGVLAIFGEPRREPFDHVDLILAADLARRAALTFEHRRLYARERQIASELQHSLLPQLPELENPEVDAIYTAATGADVGGDWYDLVELDDGSFLIVVGDVTGHGVQSAVAMGRVQSLMRHLAASGEPPITHPRPRREHGAGDARHAARHVRHVPRRTARRRAVDAHVRQCRAPPTGADPAGRIHESRRAPARCADRRRALHASRDEHRRDRVGDDPAHVHRRADRESRRADRRQHRAPAQGGRRTRHGDPVDVLPPPHHHGRARRQRRHRLHRRPLPLTPPGLRRSYPTHGRVDVYGDAIDRPAHQHEPHTGSLASRLNWLRAGVLGANDGIVSIAGLVIGVAAATTNLTEIATAGVAGLVAGAVSMSLGEYVSVSTRRDTEQAIIAEERREIAEMPDVEHAELVGMLRLRGLSPDLTRRRRRTHGERPRCAPTSMSSSASINSIS